MAFCKDCGAEVSDNQDVCLNCGVALKSMGNSSRSDSGGFGWGLLGFCIPLVGLILFLVWKTDRPITAKAAGVGALVGFILQVISWIVYAIVMATMVDSIDSIFY
ncbi:MAG: zinc ribbon domain-containing protein [Firmicutes bacterium]|nr:zinc ribbon domain-containing protein [Bacillota bacterium]